MLSPSSADNRIAQFAARFERLPTGDWAWFASDRAEGLLVTDAERTSLIEQHAAIVRRVDRLSRWGVAAAFLAVFAVVLANGGRAPGWAGPALFLVPFGWMLWEWHRAERLPRRLTERRLAVAPPRGLRRGMASRLRALPVAIPLAMLGLGSLLLVRLAMTGRLAASPLVVAEGAMLVAAALALLRLRSRR